MTFTVGVQTTPSGTETTFLLCTPTVKVLLNAEAELEPQTGAVVTKPTFGIAEDNVPEIVADPSKLKVIGSAVVSAVK